MNTGTIDDYAEIMKEDDEVFPPVTVFHDGSDYWLADGFHRYRSAQKAGLRSLRVDIRKGSHRDAIMHSVGANTTHGLRRTREDKRHAVGILLADTEWSAWSNRKIAECCGVDEKIVRTLRSASAAKPQIARTVERKGGLYKMKTGNIGKTDDRAEQSPSQPNRNDQPEQVWDHAREPATTDTHAAELSEHEPVSSSEQSCSSDEAQLHELLSAWSRASKEVREQFLASIGVSPTPQAKANPGLTMTNRRRNQRRQKSHSRHNQSRCSWQSRAERSHRGTSSSKCGRTSNPIPRCVADNGWRLAARTSHLPTSIGYPLRSWCRSVLLQKPRRGSSDTNSWS